MNPGSLPVSLCLRPLQGLALALSAAACVAPARLTAAEIRAEDVAALVEQNKALQARLAAQDAQLQKLQGEVDRLARDTAARDDAIEALERRSSTRGEGKRLSISGTGSLSFFSGQEGGQYPNSELVLDEARVLLETPVRKNTYFFAELLLATREASDENFHLGEIYVDFENVLGESVPDRLLNFRAGRLNIPFGEEYSVRYAMDNPLVTHSVTDFWGIDEGLELYGEWQKWSYAFAIQNGGISRLHDWNSDKAVTLRVGFDPTSRVHLSASAMRTGELDVANEFGSEMWLGNNVFRPMHTSTNATTFEAELLQFDAKYTWNTGNVNGAVGQGWVRDNDTLVSGDQGFDFYHLEAVQTLVGKLYGAARVSGMQFDRGYYLAGLGNWGEYFMGTELTRKLHRVTLGAGYRFSNDLNVKVEYSWEDGKLSDGEHRDKADQLAAQLAVRF